MYVLRIQFAEQVGNIAHHTGIWEKQSSFIFQSKSCLNNLTGNIHFHSPRCAVNYNDGFGGGSTIMRNLFFGTNDETGQGVFNSWGINALAAHHRYYCASSCCIVIVAMENAHSCLLLVVVWTAQACAL
jgi:hypothetical protein